MIYNIIKKIIGANNILRIKLYYYFATSNFLTSKPLATEKEYIKLHYDYIQKIKNDNFVNENFTNEEITFINKLAFTTQVVVKSSELNWMHGFLLMKTLKNYVLENKDEITIFETGTARGFSSVVMSYVLDKQGKNYNINTIDIIPHNKKIYWNCISDLKNGKTTRENLLSDYSDFLDKINFIHGDSKSILNKLNINKINFAFLDGSHEYEDVKLEFEYVNKRNNTGDIIVLDDYNYGQFDGIVKLVDEIKANNGYYIKIIDDNKKRGYAVLKKK